MTFQCWLGYEFPSAPEAFTFPAPTAGPEALAPLVWSSPGRGGSGGSRGPAASPAARAPGPGIETVAWRECAQETSGRRTRVMRRFISVSTGTRESGSDKFYFPERLQTANAGKWGALECNKGAGDSPNSVSRRKRNSEDIVKSRDNNRNGAQTNFHFFSFISRKEPWHENKNHYFFGSESGYS